MGLNLASVLEFLDPFGFFSLESIDFGLNLNSSLIFLINASYQFESLLLSFEGAFVIAEVLLLVLLASDHLFHRHRFQLVSLLLHGDHLFVLHALLLQSLGFLGIFGDILHLGALNRLLGFHTLVMVLLR